MKRVNNMEQNSQCIFWLRAEQGNLVFFPPQVENFILVCTLVTGVQRAFYPIETDGPSLETKRS
jgi:hypothetical protein